MMNNHNNKEKIEKCVVQIECVDKKDNSNNSLGTGFFVASNIIVTASHLTSACHQDLSNYDISVVPLKIELGKEIKVKRIIESKTNNYISILELEERVEEIEPLKFTVGYTIKENDEYFTFGYPRSKRIVGLPINGKINTGINKSQSLKADWDLSLGDARIKSVDGLSGSPVIIDDMLVGIIQTESSEDGASISIGMSSINLMKEFVLNRYCQDYNIEMMIQKFKNKTECKCYTIDDIDIRLQKSINLSMNLNFFEIDDDEFKKKFKTNIKKDMDKDIYIVGKSREETLYCVLNELKYVLDYNNVVVVGDEESWGKIEGEIKGAILIPEFYAGEIIAIKDNINIFIYGEDEHCIKENKIELKRRTRRTIIKKLEEAGMDNAAACRYVKDTSGLFIPLKRRLFNGRYSNDPVWSSQCCKENINLFITALLCGKWTESQGDKSVIEHLSGVTYDEFMEQLLPYSKGEEPFIIKILLYGNLSYQLANTEFAWEYLNERISKKVWDDFRELSTEIIVEIDPVFNEPFEKHYYLNSNKKAKNSNELKSGMIRSMTFRAIYGGLECQNDINKIVKKILCTIDSIQRWGYFSQFIEDLCEASPSLVMERLENEIKKPSGLYELFRSSSDDMITGQHYYTRILWAVRQLLLYKEYAARAVQWLLAIDAMHIKYNVSNSPKGILRDVFCAWFNISVLKKQDKIELAKYALEKYENAWDLIFTELPETHTVITNTEISSSYRKVDEKEIITNSDISDLYNVYADLCINNINMKIDRWMKIIEKLNIFPMNIFKKLLKLLSVNLKKMEDPEKSRIKELLRSNIYNHRFFSSAGWAMDEENLKAIEDIFNLIYFEDKIYDYLYLFNNQYALPILHPIPYKEHDENFEKKNKELKQLEIKQGIKKFKNSGLGLKHLIKLVKKENYENIGDYIAEYYTNGKFDFSVYNEMLTIPDIDSIILNYVCYIYRYNDKDIIKKVKNISRHYNGKDDLYVRLLSIEELSYTNNPAIINEDEKIKALYWKFGINPFNVSNDKKTIVWVLGELKKYDNLTSYIDCLHNKKSIFNPEERLCYMLSLISFKNLQCDWENINSCLKELMTDIETVFEGQQEKYEKIFSLEIFLINIIDWKSMKCAQYNFKTNPHYYASLINTVFLHEGETKSIKNEDEEKKITMKFNFYHKAVFCPCEKDGNIDSEELKIWIDEFKKLLEEQKQLSLLGSSLGRLFAYSPVGKDGYYPHEAIRLIIEENSDEHLRNSYVVETCNRRGIYYPNAGKEEKEIALKYKENADRIRNSSFETAKIYDALFENYNYTSAQERRSAEDGL